MSFEIVLVQNAIDDIEAAVTYYNDELAGLGNRFLNQVDSTIKRITDAPFIYSVRYANIRCAGIWRFPFLIHFNIDESLSKIFILAVYSTHQQPLWETK
ncbi:type II toxin-antitoxin system RelE/ParE family toxin [Dyadobacter sp. CY323]|uniref:type II toxin-antitoxin system RelE/ParE family toxin n=1 Tax=Dyadobacter sp. CY323 TaxID=2907302 RepID=UPI001F1F70E1|nr:type II toxin-antitoxin system RelE/ParE family toxin [Dyadobacter sp. CY323]MCE6992227.1 type II toxin-antitoxin system RelE/ParE family toxin [Dyadobacter sp. CY323]